MKTGKLSNIVRLSAYAALMVAFLASCVSTQTAVDTRDLSYLYNPIKNPVTPRYIVTTESANQASLGVKFFANELFFSEANAQGVPTSSMIITVKLFNTTRGMALSDTTQYIMNIIKEKEKQEYVYHLPINVEPNLEYVAEVKILDRLRSLVMQAFIPFNTYSLTSRYNYVARGHFAKNELFNPVVRVDEFANLVYLRGHADSLYLAYYKSYTTIPDPPSMLLPEKAIDYGPDTIVSVAYSDTLPMMFPRPGIYLCSVDSNITDGFTFLNFGPSFPEMNKPEVMIGPVAYLATENELNNMRTAERPKVALDEFWIKCGGNVEKARELIRIYYTRVLYANYYFTSYKEGWRTERGMIYLLYGPPDKVYKNPEGESWGYMKAEVRSSWGTRYKVKEEYLYFNFKKKNSTFSDNDYYISRSETLVTFWEQAVAAWRKGIVFRLDNPEEF